MKSGTVFAAALALAFSLPAVAQETPATKAQKQHEELTVRQSVDRLQQTRKNLQTAIEKLASPEAAEKPAVDAAASAPGVALQSEAIQQVEQALLDVRRAIDELDVPQAQRQAVLDRLDDADSAMRMARQPDAERERKRLQDALRKVHQEIEVAQEKLPDPPGGASR